MKPKLIITTLLVLFLGSTIEAQLIEELKKRAKEKDKAQRRQ